MCRFAVAWYPIYRIPDAPLTARFLTYHTLALPGADGSAGGSRDDRMPRAGCPIGLPLVGLKWDNRMGEPWFDVLPDVRSAVPTAAASAGGGGAPFAGDAASSGGSALAAAAAAGGNLLGRLPELSRSAERFSRGLGFEMAIGGGPVRQPDHQDFNFFKERGF